TELQSNQLGPMLVQMLQQSVNRAYQHEQSLRSSFEQARQIAIAHEGSVAKVELLERDVARLQSLEDVLI
ncbi:MAG: hypothetical protein GTO62_03060, partial [Planctomycetales bacterium]|nr:hypothetical protein [Planctomycetales bacterium]NIP68196.1 hypothetical protein [Planctomycetales bacterium]